MIIILSGGKRSGKDTFGEALIKSYPDMKFQRRAFADSMKDITMQLLGCDLKELEDLKVAEGVTITNHEITALAHGPSMRTFLQSLGQTLKDVTQNDLIWCDILAKTMDVEEENYIITDCRFPFEATFLRTLAYKAGQKVAVVKIVNPNVVNELDTHVSEQSFEAITEDFEVTNGGSIEDLEDVAKKLVTEIEEI